MSSFFSSLATFLKLKMHESNHIFSWFAFDYRWWRIGSTVQWCWTGCSSTFLRWLVSWELVGLFSRPRHSMTRGDQLMSEWLQSSSPKLWVVISKDLVICRYQRRHPHRQHSHNLPRIFGFPVKPNPSHILSNQISSFSLWVMWTQFKCPLHNNAQDFYLGQRLLTVKFLVFCWQFQLLNATATARLKNFLIGNQRCFID